MRATATAISLAAGLLLWTVGAQGQSVAVRDAYDAAGEFYQAGQYDDAQWPAEEALDLGEDELGAGHPAVATYLVGLAAVHHARGADDEAEALLERALEIREAAGWVQILTQETGGRPARAIRLNPGIGS